MFNCNRLLDAGCHILMPWGAPINSGQCRPNPSALRPLRARPPSEPIIFEVSGHQLVVAVVLGRG